MLHSVVLQARPKPVLGFKHWYAAVTGVVAIPWRRQVRRQAVQIHQLQTALAACEVAPAVWRRRAELRDLLVELRWRRDMVRLADRIADELPAPAAAHIEACSSPLELVRLTASLATCSTETRRAMARTIDQMILLIRDLLGDGGGGEAMRNDLGDGDPPSSAHPLRLVRP